MSRTTTATATKARKDLLGRMGLPAGAADDDVAALHDRIEEFLQGAPDDLRDWADRRQAEADRLAELLTGPEEELAGLAAARAAKAPATTTAFPTWAKWLAGIVAVAALVVGVYWIGRPTNNLPAMTEAATPTPTAPVLDEARVADLMAKIKDNPADIGSLVNLGNLYFTVGDYPNANTFYGKALEVDPGNEVALIGSGVGLFNTGDLATAEERFLKAAELYPNNPEVFYDLGFLYMTTSRMPEMKEAWAKVVEIAPDSDYAKTVQSHVGAVKDDAPAAGEVAPSPEPTR